MKYPKLDYKSGGAKKDACYHKVKASATVWPSAYASGRLVKCRKVGASNYGKSKKKAGGMKDFEPHMMYDPKTGKGVKANTYEKHLSLKKKGYDHRKRRMGGTKKCKYGC